MRKDITLPKILTTIALIIALLAMNRSHEAQAGTPFFSNLTMRDGLPSNIIAAMTQDKYGFLWVATGSGLARYDGHHFRVFQRNDTQKSIPSNALSAIIADGDFVWVASWGGLCKINVITYEVTRIDLGGNNTIRTLFKGSNNILWIGTASGLIQYSLNNNSIKHFNTGNSRLSHNMVRTIYEDSQGTLWVGTYDKLNKLLPGQQHFSSINLKESYRPALNNHLILDIKPVSKDDDSWLWIGTETGLYKIHTSDHSFTHYGENNISFSNEVIKGIYTGEDGSVWLGTDFGLNVFNPSTGSNEVHFHNPELPYSITNNVTWQIFEDSGGVIWFVTSNGLSKLNKFGNFYNYVEISHSVKDQLIGNQVKSFLVTREGIYWLATQHGVIRIDPRTNKRQVFDTDSPPGKRILLNNAYALVEDVYGQIWIGTAGGINIWNEQKAVMYSVTANETNKLSSNYVGKFTKTTTGELWVSAWEGGLYKVEGDLTHPENITFKLIPSLTSGSEKHVAGEGSIWVMEYDELYRINPSDLTKTHITSFSDVSRQQMIYCVYFSKQGHLWAGTQNGLLEYNPLDNTTYFHAIRSSQETVISSITEDAQGNIWSTTNSSLQKLNPASRSQKIFPLDKNIPLKSFYYGCATTTPSGELIFGGDNGYIIFDPLKAKPNSYQPPVYLTALEINNKNITVGDDLAQPLSLVQDVSFTKELDLKYEQRSVTLEFSSLHFWQPSMNAYAYRLEGFDDDWNYVSGLKNFAVYSNLPAGSYTFRVKGTNNYGIESEKEASLLITINPPLFLRSGFIVLYAILILSAIYYALKTYSARVHLKNEIRIIKMEKEHAEEIEHTKEQFFTNISHELRTPISLILPPIHEVQKKGNLDPASKHLISLAEKNSIRLLKLVNQILDFNKLENDVLHINVAPVELVRFCQDVFSLFSDQAMRHRIDFQFHTSIDSQQVWVDMEKIETVLFNLLSNAFKFTPSEGVILFSIGIKEDTSEFQEGSFEISLSDSGTGIAKEDQTKIFERFYQSQEGKKMEASTGIGLTLAAEYIKLHHGTIRVRSELGQGTTFIVQLPLGKTHFPIDSGHNETAINLLAKKSIYTPEKGKPPYQLNLVSDKPLVLIIDDNIDMIEFIRTSLSVKYNFVVAEDGLEGLSKAGNFLPQVIVSDVMMPAMNGLALCRKIKEDPKTSHISFILLTAKSMLSQRIEGIRTGADVYLTKPFEIDLLDAHIEHLIKRKKDLEDYFKNELIHLPEEAQAHKNEDNKFVKQVMNIIEANISNPDLSVEMISEHIGISSTHLYRKLKLLTNHSAKDIIKKYRIKKASLLLKNKEGNISEIMYDVGFSSLSYFSKCFKTEFGIAPKEYQQKMTGKINIEEKFE